MIGVVPPLPNTPSWRGAQIKIKHRTILPYFFLPLTRRHNPKDLDLYVDRRENVKALIRNDCIRNKKVHSLIEYLSMHKEE
jgi:hypothetical protein